MFSQIFILFIYLFIYLFRSIIICLIDLKKSGWCGDDREEKDFLPRQQDKNFLNLIRYKKRNWENNNFFIIIYFFLLGSVDLPDFSDLPNSDLLGFEKMSFWSTKEERKKWENDFVTAFVGNILMVKASLLTI